MNDLVVRNCDHPRTKQNYIRIYICAQTQRQVAPERGRERDKERELERERESKRSIGRERGKGGRAIQREREIK